MQNGTLKPAGLSSAQINSTTHFHLSRLPDYLAYPNSQPNFNATEFKGARVNLQTRRSNSLALFTNSTPFIGIPSSSHLQVKHYHANSESEGTDWRFNKKFSMINYQKTNFDPISHANIKSRPSTTSHKLRGLEDYALKTIPKMHKKYWEAVSNDTAAFRRKSGEFTIFDDACLQRNGGNPFRYPKLSRNKSMIEKHK
ncbi:unnamed protein product [Blepharisma stoltei]|uniref:Uncharacterized protein n=1 Tax=Blepharisma stoltei TaxID=1481888 RepID=A0AAU9JJM3_9CILI|nr:unnamed protein product [Blepharisma stoltei]